MSYACLLLADCGQPRRAINGQKQPFAVVKDWQKRATSESLGVHIEA